MNKIHRFGAIFALAILFAIAFAVPCGNSTTSAATSNPADKITLITKHPFSIKVLKNNHDITDKIGIKTGKYNQDGTGTRTMLDGTIVSGTWKFVNDEQTHVQVEALGKITRWEIIELTENVYRKRSLDDKTIEFIQTPIK